MKLWMLIAKALEASKWEVTKKITKDVKMCLQQDKLFLIQPWSDQNSIDTTCFSSLVFSTNL